MAWERFGNRYVVGFTSTMYINKINFQKWPQTGFRHIRPIISDKISNIKMYSEIINK